VASLHDTKEVILTSLKLKAIDELKEKAQRGEKLETTQHKKIESEAEIRKELNVLMASTA
jgi:translation initiation factor 2A